MIKNRSEKRETRQRGVVRSRLVFGLLTASFAFCAALRAAIPSPEKLLPEDTLVVVTAPDFGKLSAMWRSLPQRQFWDDPAMKPFREKFVSKWNEEVVQPLERELDAKCDDYTSLLQGQLTFAVTQNGWQGGDDASPGVLVLLDTRDKGAQLKKNLADLRKKWVDAGKSLKTEKIRDVEFIVLPLSSNDVPKTLRKLFPPSSEVQELGDEKETKKAAPKTELVLGQVDSLLIFGNSTKVVEKVMVRLAGGSVASLGEQASYQACQPMFRESPVYGWVNVKTLMDVLTKAAAEKKDNPDAPNPFDFKPEKVFAALGLSGLKTLAFSFQSSNEGELLQVSAGVPEASRQGVFKILAGEPKDSNPPPFVPADAVKFQRWRIDGKKAWATLEKMLGDFSQQAYGVLKFVLDSADARAKEKDSEFDIRKNLIGNLGDDIVYYEKAPRGSSAAELQSPPSIFLLGSPKPEVLTTALKSLFVIFPQGDTVAEREFLGRKIYSVPLPALPFPTTSPKPSAARTLSYAASGGYVALATDASLLEEYLRSSDSQAKALRETAGLAEAAQKVTGPGTSLFGYENDVESTKASFESLRKGSGATSNSTSAAAANLVPGLGIAGAGQELKDWMDFSLLPPFDKIAKYFYFRVYGDSANVDGLTFKMFSPVPPGLKGAGIAPAK
ncbi:MAG TPA: hypothetical protein VN578_01620 [Candidatus Binatia bacterium]|jgi:hypothetical protein|nr:hypothetical protein [Candidatus Binatia bacterium]